MFHIIAVNSYNRLKTCHDNDEDTDDTDDNVGDSKDNFVKDGEERALEHTDGVVEEMDDWSDSDGVDERMAAVVASYDQIGSGWDGNRDKDQPRSIISDDSEEESDQEPRKIGSTPNNEGSNSEERHGRDVQFVVEREGNNKEAADPKVLSSGTVLRWTLYRGTARERDVLLSIDGDVYSADGSKYLGRVGQEEVELALKEEAQQIKEHKDEEYPGSTDLDEQETDPSTPENDEDEGREISSSCVSDGGDSDVEMLGAANTSRVVSPIEPFFTPLINDLVSMGAMFCSLLWEAMDDAAIPNGHLGWNNERQHLPPVLVLQRFSYNDDNESDSVEDNSRVDGKSVSKRSRTTKGCVMVEINSRTFMEHMNEEDAAKRAVEENVMLSAQQLRKENKERTKGTDDHLSMVDYDVDEGNVGMPYDPQDMDLQPFGKGGGEAKGVVGIFCDLCNSSIVSKCYTSDDNDIVAEGDHDYRKITTKNGKCIVCPSILAARCLDSIRQGDAPLSRLVVLNSVLRQAYSGVGDNDKSDFIGQVENSYPHGLLSTLFTDLVCHVELYAMNERKANHTDMKPTKTGTGQHIEILTNPGRHGTASLSNDVALVSLRYRLGFLASILTSSSLLLSYAQVRRLWQAMVAVDGVARDESGDVKEDSNKGIRRSVVRLLLEWFEHAARLVASALCVGAIVVCKKDGGIPLPENFEGTDDGPDVHSSSMKGSSNRKGNVCNGRSGTDTVLMFSASTLRRVFRETAGQNMLDMRASTEYFHCFEAFFLASNL